MPRSSRSNAGTWDLRETILFPHTGAVTYCIELACILRHFATNIHHILQEIHNEKPSKLQDFNF